MRVSRFFLVGILFSLLFLSACTVQTPMMPPSHRELALDVGDQQSFRLRGTDVDVSVHYLQAEPTHLLEIVVDGDKEMIIIEDYQRCPPPKNVGKKIIDKQGKYVGMEWVTEQEPCWFAWEQNDVHFSTSSLGTTLRLGLYLKPGFFTSLASSVF